MSSAEALPPVARTPGAHPTQEPAEAEPSTARPAAQTGVRRRHALRQRLPLWIRLRCGLEPRALAALVIALVAAMGFAAHHFWIGRPETVHAPQLVGDSRTTLPVLQSLEPRLSRGIRPAPGSGDAPRIVVDVSGKVHRPGVLQLPAGSRVADALRAAGGVKSGTDLTGLNRARVLIDGEQVVVGATPPPGVPTAGQPGVADAGTPGGPGAVPLSLNSATVAQLDRLPGVGPVLAQHIVDYRTEHAGFRSVDELREVKGIGDRRFAELSALVRP
ncbi:helix-hairpin-helix domain-containing protein [Streptomyces sp. NPDC127084]|uniref:helix-hairpin-helix domain-containing protein n=1 Tax=Streptomyces sp. NPDC127084 TaxID=3347133 RepID=UPI003652E6C0